MGLGPELIAMDLWSSL